MIGMTDKPERATRAMSTAGPCSHENTIREVKPQTHGCEECVAMGDRWMHLRMCLACGHVGCCDESKNKHATAHHRETGHPIVQSIEPGEDWKWCFVDETFLM